MDFNFCEYSKYFLPLKVLRQEPFCNKIGSKEIPSPLFTQLYIFETIT